MSPCYILLATRSFLSMSPFLPFPLPLHMLRLTLALTNRLRHILNSKQHIHIGQCVHWVVLSEDGYIGDVFDAQLGFVLDE